ncbi:unnamed protein product [Phytophthora fragariaefolia]|uniref:Unnamed protein product n=1 Tax=Phytophthora fragariaefolia TaxID=1490495 RepID=A0A9W6XVB5_9STRA|nr:unnamed protein product [Phytophthora fragariaefolia]
MPATSAPPPPAARSTLHPGRFNPRTSVFQVSSSTDELVARISVNKTGPSSGIPESAQDPEWKHSSMTLVFGELKSLPARNWYRQLARSIRSDWKSLLGSFLVQYCERGVSVASQYYPARKISDETPIEYLHRLNVAGLRAKLPIEGGTPSTRREDVEHFIETLADRDLANQLVLLRLRDTDEVEETLRIRQRSKSRQGGVAVGSDKFRKPAAPTTNSVSAKPSRVVHAIQTADGSSSSGSDNSRSDQNAGYHRIHVAAANDRDAQENQASNYREFPNQNQSPDRDRSPEVKQFSHCGSTRHDNFSCWKRLRRVRV